MSRDLSDMWHQGLPTTQWKGGWDLDFDNDCDDADHEADGRHC